MKPLSERLWSHVDRREPDECWPWTASTNNQGYGQIEEANGKRVCRRSLYAHRVVWSLVFGPIPDGMEVCHKCDTPRCCNPSHLFLGTHGDNMADMARKGRAANNTIKLSPQQVLEIRRAFAPKPKRGVVTALSRAYGVSLSTIIRTCRRESWKWLDETAAM